MNKIRALIIFFVIFTFGTKAQDYYNDAQVWLNFYVNKKINKRFDLRGKVQARMTNNVMDVGRVYGDIGITYKLNKHVRFLADYVYGETKRKTIGYKPRHVFFAAIVLKQDWKRWRFAYRNMLQARYVAPGESKTGYVGYYFDRNKVDIRYEATKRYSFYVAEEVNIPLNDPKVTGIAISRTRSYIGTIINLSTRQQLELYFMFQAKLISNDWFSQKDTYPNARIRHYYVYGISYKIDL